MKVHCSCKDSVKPGIVDTIYTILCLDDCCLFAFPPCTFPEHSEPHTNQVQEIEIEVKTSTCLSLAWGGLLRVTR